jgi:hypothetical protein
MIQFVRKHINLFVLLVVIIFCSSYKLKENKEPITLDYLFNTVDEKMGNVASLQYYLKRTERIDNEIVSVKNYIRIQTEPFNCMIQFLGDKEGDYVIYSPTKNDGKAVFIPGGFPYINISLDTDGYIMRRTSHYRVVDMGVKFVVDKIKGNYLKWKDKFKYEGVVAFDGINYHKIEGVLGELSYINYVPKENETLTEVAEKHFVSEYMLLDINDNVDDFNDDIEGESIKVPTSYASHIVMYVNVITFFPEMILIEDDKGVFEEYKYTEIVYNEPIDPKYFDESLLGN